MRFALHIRTLPLLPKRHQQRPSNEGMEGNPQQPGFGRSCALCDEARIQSLASTLHISTPSPFLACRFSIRRCCLSWLHCCRAPICSSRKVRLGAVWTSKTSRLAICDRVRLHVRGRHRTSCPLLREHTFLGTLWVLWTRRTFLPISMQIAGCQGQFHDLYQPQAGQPLLYPLWCLKVSTLHQVPCTGTEGCDQRITNGWLCYLLSSSSSGLETRRS